MKECKFEVYTPIASINQMTGNNFICIGALLSEKDTGYDSDLTSTGPEPKSCTSPAVAVEQQSDLQGD